MSLTRDIVGALDWVRSGQWSSSGAYPLQRTISRASIGIAGLGRIGEAVASRLQGFETDIHFYARSDKDKPDWAYHDNLVSLAKNVSILMVCLSGGPATSKMISADVLTALGPDGVLVNSARGTTIDEEALITALQTKQLRAAALDVYNNEPNIDPRWLTMENVLLQPHQSSGTVETRQRMGALQRENLLAFFAGKPLITPVG